MKFGKLANLKKWHLLRVAGRQMWPNGNGNGYHCQKQGYWSGILLPVFCELTPALSWLVAEVQLALEELVWVEAKKAIGGHQVSSHYDQLMGSVRSLTFHERGFVFVPSSILYFRIYAVAQCPLYTQIACHKPCDTRWVATTPVCCWFWIPSLFILELNKSILSTPDGVQAHVWRNAFSSAHELCSPMKPQFVLAWYVGA